MPRRKKPRFSQKKKAQDKKFDRVTPDGLSERQFLALQDFGSFIMEDSEHEPHSFATDDVVYLLHQGSEDSGETLKDNHWIGKIRNIRGGGPDNVWIQVQWYWAPEEVAEVIKSFDPNACGKYEKLFSNNLDIISVHCVVGHVQVKPFNETDIYQVPIGEEEWFSRYEFCYEGRRITPKVSHIACPICKIPYTPGVDKILHFCPRPNCRKFYHQPCLVKNDYVEETRRHRILETWPDIDRTASVEDIACFFHPKKRQKKDSLASRESMQDPLANFPTELVAVANQQILRGIQGAGVVGNIASVVAARQLIYRALTKNEPIPGDWETRVDTSIPFPEPNTLPNCICPECYSAI